MTQRRKKRKNPVFKDTSNMGGVRPGSGRKVTGKARTPISAAVAPSLKEAIKARADANPDPEWSFAKEVEVWLNVALPTFVKEAQAREGINAELTTRKGTS